MVDGHAQERKVQLNAHHARTARFIIERANRRSRNPNGREASAERRKVSDAPDLDCMNLTADRRPPIVYSPQSSWNSVSRGITVTEYLGEGFSVSQQKGQGRIPRRPSGALTKL
jgi:Tfp pilus assembly protein PilX